MKNYINPFEERKFDVRFRAVFEFAKQNFVNVFKYNLLIYIAFAALFSALLSFVPNFNARFVGCGLAFVSFSYFWCYIISKGDMRAVSFKKRLSSMGIAFIQMLILGMLLAGCMIPLIVIVAALIYVGVGLLWIALILSPVLIFLFLFMAPLSNIIYAHCYFSNGSMGDVFKEVFHMLKGHWWSTWGFFLIFGVISSFLIGFFSLLPICIVVFFPDNAYVQFFGYLIVFTVSFIVAFFTTDASIVFQYGHLKALKEKQERKAENDSSVLQEGMQRTC